MSTNKGNKMNVKIIGIGGGGINVIDCFQKMDDIPREYILMDTHIQSLYRQSLQFNNAPKKVQLGKHITEGRGAANPLTGIDSAVDSLNEIREVISGADVIFIVACMGGGTATAVAPIVAKEAAKQGIATIGLAALPFDFEGKKRKHRAEMGVELLKKQLTFLRIYKNKSDVLTRTTSVLEPFIKSDHAQAAIIKEMVDNIDEFIGSNNKKVEVMIPDINEIRQQFSEAEKGLTIYKMQ